MLLYIWNQCRQCRHCNYALVLGDTSYFILSSAGVVAQIHGLSILFMPLSVLRGWRQAGLSKDIIEIVKININMVILAGVANVG